MRLVCIEIRSPKRNAPVVFSQLSLQIVQWQRSDWQ
jgi:hypothetical protein